MWEYRLIWDSAPPAWWNAAWRDGKRSLAARGRSPEQRPDTYLVVVDRPDVGLKTRGTAGEFEAKLRHRCEDGWELWEKIPFFRWNDLEMTRLSVAMQHRLSDSREARSPVDGVKAALAASDVAIRDVTVAKSRLQMRAAEILPAIGVTAADPSWLAELVEIQRPGRPPAWSLCFESMTPSPGMLPIPGRDEARNFGYPAFLAGRE